MFDIGANLTSSHFSKDLDVVLNDSLKAGVEKICITSSNLDDVKNAKKITEKYKNLYYSVGFHPHNAKDFKDSHIDKMLELCEHDYVKAIGECGLDYKRNYSSKNDQINCFTKHLELATSIINFGSFRLIFFLGLK